MGANYIQKYAGMKGGERVLNLIACKQLIKLKKLLNAYITNNFVEVITGIFMLQQIKKNTGFTS